MERVVPEGPRRRGLLLRLLEAPPRRVRGLRRAGGRAGAARGQPRDPRVFRRGRRRRGPGVHGALLQLREVLAALRGHVRRLQL